MKIIRFHSETLTSTQEQAKKNREQLTPEKWHLFTADEQTKGKGTQNKIWFSPPNSNIYATFSFLISKQQSQYFYHLPQVVALSITETLIEFGFNAKIKWINDVLIQSKKIAGVLCESSNVVSYPEHLALYIGIGLNINLAKEFCDHVDQPITSLRVESNNTIWDKEIILEKLQKVLYDNLLSLWEFGFHYFMVKINSLLAGYHQKINFHSTTAVFFGSLKGVNDKGHLILELESGEIKIFSEGKMRIVNPENEIL